LKRHFTLSLIVTALVLVTTLSLLSAPAAVSSEEVTPDEVTSKLRELQKEILELPNNAFTKPCPTYIQRRVLTNKIGVVINMVEVGAYQGAIQKLEKDVKKTVEHWLTEEYAEDIIEKINEIISLLKKLKPHHPHFPNFTITAFPKSLTVEQGSTNSTTIVIISLKGFNKPVNLTADISPQTSDVTLSLDPQQVTPPKNDYATSSLTVKAANDAEIGTYNITVTATSGRLTHHIEISLEVLPAHQPPPIFNFSISAYPPSLNAQQGGSNASIITVTSLSAASQLVDLAVTSEPITGVKATLNPLQVIPPSYKSAISILTVEANATAELGDHTITVTGTSDTLQRSVNITLKITAPPVQPIPDFHIAAFPPSLTIQAGHSGISTIAVISVRDFSQSVNLTAKSESSESITLSLNPSEVTPEPNNFTISTLTVEVKSTTTPGNYKITVTGTSDTLKHNATITLVVTSPPIPPTPDFSVTASPTSLRVQQGSLGAASIIVTSLNGFNQPVNLDVISIEGVNLTLDPKQVTPLPNGFASSTLSVFVDTTTTPSEHEITVKGTSGSLEHTAKILLEVVAEETPPQIVSVLRLPEHPTYNDSVTVMAFVTDVGTGVNRVVLSYTGGVVWTNVTMTLTDGLYSASIPAFPYAVEVEYRVYATDRAGNSATPSSLDSYRVADPYPPVIGVPTWTPEEPEANEDITVNVTVTEPTMASGVRNVTLWFKNKTLENWKAVPMLFSAGNWTATLSNQSDTLIDFKIEAFDQVGNSVETEIYEFQVKAPTGWPLALILLIILILAALVGSVVYLLWRRRRGRKGAGAVSPIGPPASPSVPPVAPVTAVAAKLVEARFGMVSFVVPAHNEESAISRRIASAYERAASHAGASEIIVVDDGSLDGTYEAAWSAIESNRKKWPNIPVKVVKLSANMGKEEAVRVGRNKATGEIVETINGNNTPTIASFISHFFIPI